ncbi:MAG: hypothetical protein ACE37D_01140 [Pseudomonadales bacterium]
MIKKPTVTVSHDPAPLELIFAKKIRDALEHEAYAKETAGLRGKFAIQSATDPQAVTIHVTDAGIALTSGAAKDCDLVLTIDLNNPAAKPKIKGLFRSPLLLLKVGKFMDFPAVSWADALKRFWEQHHEVPEMPSGLTVKCLDEDRQLSVGQSESACYFEGPAAVLAEAFSGGAPFVQLLASGKLSGRYTLKHATVMSDITLHMMLGETA